MLWKSAKSLISYEIHLFFQFSWRDWSAAIIPGCLFAFGAAKGLPYSTTIWNSLPMFLWITAYTYAFNLFSQVNSVEEDRINKPDRPLPSRIVTKAGTWRRCIVVWALFFSLAIIFPSVILETVTHAVMTLFLTTTRLGGTWFGKNCVSMSIMTWSLLSGSRKFITPLTPLAFRKVISLAFWVGLSAETQDFRDQKGDLATGRQTLPIVFGDNVARYIVAFFNMPLAFAVVYWFGIGAYTLWLLAAGHVLVSYRIVVFRGVEADHQTYMVDREKNVWKVK
ncbi:ubiquinone biosynthesis protein [Fusarium langsethiae]|uniref:Ubiquinone biosynthesis protein n=1 Tax=Fusarium langsethiae TaxID=179993 RepID=A0A0M9EL39_FUSLA|nr:ubiquinone biosynthesis protein [Fusarium langsethiae]